MNGALDSVDHSRSVDSQLHEKAVAPVGRRVARQGYAVAVEPLRRSWGFLA